MHDGGKQTGDGRPLPSFPLSEEQRMLLEIRDSLYEGCWEDFERDLEARQANKPHVFETVPESAHMLRTISTHLVLIREMRGWEQAHGVTLTPRAIPPKT